MIIRKALLACTTSLIALGYENEPGWKMDGDKIATDGEGNPILISPDGSEKAVRKDTIPTLNSDMKQLRIAKETAEKTLNAYKGADGKLIDPAIATKAIETVSKLDAKKLIDAGEVDRVREEIKSEFTQQLTDAQNALADRENTINSMRIDGIFKGSDFLAERVAVPRDMVEAALRNNFKVEDGKVVAYDKDGNRLLSKRDPGAYADPNEAIEMLIERHPQKDMILKAPDANGTGNKGGGGQHGQGRMLKRADFDAMDPGAKATAGAAAAKGELTIVD